MNRDPNPGFFMKKCEKYIVEENFGSKNSKYFFLKLQIRSAEHENNTFGPYSGNMFPAWIWIRSRSNPDPGPKNVCLGREVLGCGSAWIRIIFGSWIRIRTRIRVKSWIRIRIKVKNLKFTMEAFRLTMEPWRIFRPVGRRFTSLK